MSHDYPEYKRRIRQKREQLQQETRREQHEAAEDARIEKVIATVERLIKQIDSYTSENSPEKKRKRRWEKAEVIGLWAAAIVGAIAIIAGSNDASETRAAIEQRPWVYEDHTFITPFFINEAGEYDISIRFVLHNSGRLPAVLAWPAFKLFRLGVPGGRPYSDLIRDVCHKSVEEPITEQTSGITVFPGQEVPITVTPPVGISPQQWKDAAKIIDKWVIPVAVGCVLYQEAGHRGIWHRTGFAFLIGRKAGGMEGVGPMPLDPTTIPATDLASYNAPTGAAAFIAD